MSLLKSLLILFPLGFLCSLLNNMHKYYWKQNNPDSKNSSRFFDLFIATLLIIPILIIVTVILYADLI